MTRNKAMLNEIADIISLNPKLHDQDNWLDQPSEDLVVTRPSSGKRIHCGTSQCVAGWALLIDHHDNKRSYGESDYLEFQRELGEDYISFKGDQVEVEDAAAEILGLEKEDANQIFYNMSDHNELDWPQALRDIAAGVGISDAFARAER